MASRPTHTSLIGNVLMEAGTEVQVGPGEGVGNGLRGPPFHSPPTKDILISMDPSTGPSLWSHSTHSVGPWNPISRGARLHFSIRPIKPRPGSFSTWSSIKKSRFYAGTADTNVKSELCCSDLAMLLLIW